MIPSDVQLKLRLERLKQIYEDCKALCNQSPIFAHHRLEFENHFPSITHQSLESVGIDVSPMDIDTGATCGSVTPYFLPRLSFPSSRDITPLGNKGMDRITEYGDSRENRDERNLKLHIVVDRFFPGHYVHTSGWKLEDSLGGFDDPEADNTLKLAPYALFRRGHRYKNESGSHHKTEVSVLRCGKDLPSLFELGAVFEEIHDATDPEERERKKLEHFPEKFVEKQPAFHPINPILLQISDGYGQWRLLSAYFDGSRLKIQLTPNLDFSSLALVPPPDKSYLEMIDLQSYHDNFDRLLKWAWPIAQGDTGSEMLTDMKTV